MIPEEHRAELIQSGIHFMRSITNVYGPVEGMKLWDTIVDTLDKDIKGAIFFALVTGEFNDRITLSAPPSGSNKVWMVKSVRTVTGKGLKEAMDLVNQVLDGKSVTIECDPKNRNNALYELRNAGFYV